MEIDGLRAKMGGDFFALLGLPHAYAVDGELLKKNYLALSRLTHPDFYAGDPRKLGEVLALSAAVNDAYRTLRDPVRRAEYVLLAHGGKDAGADKRVPAEMLGEVLTMNEEIAEAREAGDDAVLAGFRRQMEERRVKVQAEIERLAARLTESGEARRTGDGGTLDALRMELNAMKYVWNLLEQLG